MATARQNSVQALLLDPLKQVDKAADVLCYFFRDALITRRITVLIWTQQLYPAYMDRKEDRDERKDRGNLNNQLTSNNFTWATFKRGIEFLGPKRAAFSVILHYDDEDEGRKYTALLDPNEDETDDIIDDSGISPDTVIKFQDDKQKDSTLARLFQSMVRDLGIDKKKWEEMLDAFMTHPYQIGIKEEEIPKRRRNFDSDLRRKRFSWRLFRHAIVFLQAKYVSFELVLEWTEGKAEVHTLNRLAV